MIDLLKYNKRFFLVSLLLWSILLENAFSFGEFFSLGGGFELKLSFLIRVFIIIISFNLFFKGKLLNKFIKPVTYLSLTIIFFLIYGYLQFPQYSLRSISVTIQTLSILLIIPFLYYENSKNDGTKIFLKQLRIFALFNAISVIFSYFFPNSFEFFETSSSRYFGIMGDEIAIFLIFFIIDAIHNKSWKSLIIYIISLMLTGSIGAFFSFVFALIYYLNKVKFLSLNNFSRLLFILLAVIFISIFIKNDILELSIFKRIDENILNPGGSSLNLRVMSMNTALELINEFHLMGIGFGVYGAYIADNFKYLPESEIVIISSSYNQYLQVICEMGVIGLLIYLNFILKSIKHIKPGCHTDYNIVIHVWLFTFFLTVQSANWFLPSSFLFILLVSLVSIGLIRKKNERIFI